MTVAALMPRAEMVHWWFASGFLLLGLVLLAEGIVGREVWGRRRWRLYLWPGLLFLMGVLLWPVMTFYTNSTIHMVAHGSWAEVLMLAGAAASRPLQFADLPQAMREAVDSEPEAARIARKIGSARALVVLGRGYGYAAALETALKIKELARVWAEPYSSADFAHGPRALLERGTPVLILGARGATERETRSLAAALRRRGARVYAITDDEALAAKVDDAVLLRRAVGELLSPIVLVVAAQHVAAHVARRHGRGPLRLRLLHRRGPLRDRVLMLERDAQLVAIRERDALQGTERREVPRILHATQLRLRGAELACRRALGETRLPA